MKSNDPSVSDHHSKTPKNGAASTGFPHSYERAGLAGRTDGAHHVAASSTALLLPPAAAAMLSCRLQLKLAAAGFVSEKVRGCVQQCVRFVALETVFPPKLKGKWF